MSNKYIYLGIGLLVLLGAGFLYTNFLAPEGSRGISTGVIREFTLTAEKDAWKFEPDVIEVNQGDTVKLTVVNEDEYDHGLAIDVFGISQRIAAKSTTIIEFVATQPGEFPYYCSVPCGEGEVDGHTRGHFDQVGKLKVKAAVTVTP